MRWNVEQQKEPKDGEIRCSLKFAWGKVRIGDQWVWLERYWFVERYHRSVTGRGCWEEDKKEIYIPEYH